MSSQRGAPSSPPQRHSTPLFMPTSSPVRLSSSVSLTPRMARLSTHPISSIGASSPLLYGGTSSSVGRRTPGPRSTASLSRHDLARFSRPQVIILIFLEVLRHHELIVAATLGNNSIQHHHDHHITVVKSFLSVRISRVN